MSDNPILEALKDLLKMVKTLETRVEDLEYMHNNTSVMSNHDTPKRWRAK